MNGFDFAVMICGVFLTGFSTGIAIALKLHMEWKDEAVRKGKAEYYLDENNNKRWRWRP